MVSKRKSCGAESLQKNQKKMWSADEKYELIAKVLAGVSITESAISAGVEPSLLSQWVRCYKMKGYQGLAAQRKGRPPKEPDMKKKIVPAELTPSEREELIRLRAENEYLRTENEVIKKRIALRQEKFAAQLKAKKLHSSTNSEERILSESAVGGSRTVQVYILLRNQQNRCGQREKCQSVV